GLPRAPARARRAADERPARLSSPPRDERLHELVEPQVAVVTPLADLAGLERLLDGAIGLGEMPAVVEAAAVDELAKLRKALLNRSGLLDIRRIRAHAG